MKIYRGLQDHFEPLPHPVATIGTFDGVHQGHRKVLADLKALAQQHKGTSVVITFDPHPRSIIPEKPFSQPSLLSSTEEKIVLLDAIGIDLVWIIPFNESLSKMHWTRFVSGVLIGPLKTKTLVIGYDHRFGYQREGNIHGLRQLAPEYGFDVIEIGPKQVAQMAVSSTNIRQALMAGNIKMANNLLGYNYCFSASVVHGDKRGASLGFPTANLIPSFEEKLIPSNGVYAVWVRWNGAIWPGMMNIGMKPTFGGKNKTIEVHIFDFKHEIYGQSVQIAFADRIRDEQKFNSKEALVAQLHLDAHRCRALLNLEQQFCIWPNCL